MLSQCLFLIPGLCSWQVSQFSARFPNGLVSLVTSAMKFSLLMVKSPISCTVFRPRRQLKSFGTTIKSASLTCVFLGFKISKVTCPRGVTFDLFHTINFYEVDFTWDFFTNFWHIVFTSAPESNWNLTSKPLTCIKAVTRLWSAPTTANHCSSHSSESLPVLTKFTFLHLT